MGRVASTLALLLLVTGCEDDPAAHDSGAVIQDASKNDVPSDARSDASTDASEDVPADAPVDAPVDAGSPGDAGTDEGVDVAGMEPTPGSRFFDEREGSITALCMCVAESEGFPSVESCSGTRGASPATRACFIEAASEIPELDEVFTCYAMNESAFGACVVASECEEAAINVCREDSFLALEKCGVAAALLIRHVGRQAECLVGPPGTCPDSIGPAGTMGAAVFSGVTVGAGNDRPLDPAGCQSDAPDRTHVWTAPAAGSWTIDTAGSDFDTIVSVFEDCDAETAMRCSDDMRFAEHARVTVTLAEGQRILIVVDGFSPTTAGNYVVNIRPGF